MSLVARYPGLLPIVLYSETTDYFIRCDSDQRTFTISVFNFWFSRSQLLNLKEPISEESIFCTPFKIQMLIMYCKNLEFWEKTTLKVFLTFPQSPKFLE